MEKTILSALFFLCFVQYLFIVAVHARLAPALYVFGDSLSDPGNNIFLSRSIVKATFKPYGIDFPNGTFGRFTNGFTLADHLAISLGLPLSPPILDPRSLTTNCTNGFNYASASAGILSDTGLKIAGANLCLGEQVRLFKKTAQEFLPSRLRNQKAVKRHLRKSIYLIVIGANDYSLNYNNPALSDNSKIYDVVQFAEHLVNKLERQVQELYNLGARKFVISEIGPLGCTPGAKMFALSSTKCVNEVNALVSSFNIKLASKINQLGESLNAATFVTMKGDFLAKMIENPGLYGFEDSDNPCCTIGSVGVECQPNVPPCKNRRAHVFFDAAHTTDAANKYIAQACFKGVGACTPINIRQLAKQH